MQNSETRANHGHSASSNSRRLQNSAAAWIEARRPLEDPQTSGKAYEP
jgi:hypothetical protein